MSFVSQALNSGTNLALSILVARASSPDQYGAWAIAYAAYVLSLQATRAVVSTPILLLSPDDEPTSSLRIPALSATACAGLVSGFLVLTVIPFLTDIGWQFALIFAASMPLLLLQDAFRYLAFRDRRGIEAAAIDLLWIILQVVGFGLCFYLDFVTGVTMTITWAAAAGLSALLWLAIRRTLPRLGPAIHFLRTNARMSLKLLVESMLGTGVLQLLPALLALAAGLSVAGGMRASQTVFGPITFMIMGITPVMTTAIVHRIREGRPYIRLLWIMCAVVALSSILGYVLLKRVPAVGEALVGDSWPLVAAILLPAMITAGLRGAVAGSPIILRARHQLNAAISLRARTAVPALLLPVAGAVIADLQGAAWGAAAAGVVNSVQSLRSLRGRGERIR